MNGIGSVGRAPAGRQPEDPKLMEQAKKLEGVFVAQLYQAMRATVPEGGAVESSDAEQLFTEMMDDAVADLNSRQEPSALARALYEQLRPRASAFPDKTNS